MSRIDTVQDAMEQQALLLVQMITDVFEDATKATTLDEHKAVARRAWSLQGLSRAWQGGKRVIDLAFPARHGGGDGDGNREPRGLDELEQQIQLGTERLKQLLYGKAPAPLPGQRGAGGGGAGLGAAAVAPLAAASG